jgi:F-type H+-transporting ATPase subunit b
MKIPRQTMEGHDREALDFSRAVNAAKQSSSLAAEGRRPLAILRPLLAFAILAFILTLHGRAHAQQQPPAPAKTATQSDPDHKSFGRELAEETRESTGAKQEDHSELTHSAMVRFFARKTGLTVHQAHLVALSLNFAIVVGIVFWAFRKFVPGMLRNRTQSIQQALEEARAASQDANRRLSSIETRLRQLDVEIGQMQATAEKEAEAEEARIHKDAEEDIRKVVLAAEQEIIAAGKQARRELTTHTAGLAIALASKQINVDSNADQVLVRTFAANLTSHRDTNGGKDSQ